MQRGETPGYVKFDAADRPVTAEALRAASYNWMADELEAPEYQETNPWKSAIAVASLIRLTENAHRPDAQSVIDEYNRLVESL